MSAEQARDIIAALRSGLVPHSGLHHIAVGLDKLMDRVEEELARVAGGSGRGDAKWIRGDRIWGG